MNRHLIPRRMSRRAFLVLLVYVAAFTAAYWLSYCLRFDFDVVGDPLMLFWVSLPAVLVIKLIVFYWLGHCHASWQYVTFSDLAAILRATTLSVLTIAALDLFMAQNIHIPRAVMLLDWGLTIMILGGLRAIWRLSREEFRPLLYRNGCRKALIVGANRSGETLARHLMADARLKYLVVGFLDQDRSRVGSTLGGIPVLGQPDDAHHIALAIEADDVLVISGLLPGQRLRQMMEDCAAAEVSLKVIPALDDLVNSNYAIQVRNVDIEDLLRREPVELNNDAISSLIADQTVMVTGAGGSIGAEVCRQVLKYGPKQLLLVERTENNLFLIEQELRGLRIQADLVPCIADITDAQRMSQIFDAYRPEVVFHAAAHKHVPMMEYNPGEAIKNNVVGTRQLAELANRFATRHFVMISTDKAVNPTSVMGVSKQLAERFVHAFSERATTKFVVVRFGNVLASAGSVVPIFQDQIRRGGPVTVTHPDIERYFMTIPEASQLVLQAAAMGRGGEIFVLDMGQSVRILDLAKDLIRLSGLKADDIEIVFTGLRPGEKLFEELYFDDEEMQPTPHPKVFVAYHRPYALAEVLSAIDELSTLVHGRSDALLKKIKQLVPEYRISDTDRLALEESGAIPVLHLPVPPLKSDPEQSSRDATSRRAQ